MNRTRGVLVSLGLIVALCGLGVVAWLWQQNSATPPRAGLVLSRTADTLTIGDSTHAANVRIGASTLFRRLDSPAGFTSLQPDEINLGEYVVVSQEGVKIDDPAAQIDVFPTFPGAAS